MTTTKALCSLYLWSYVEFLPEQNTFQRGAGVKTATYCNVDWSYIGICPW